MSLSTPSGKLETFPFLDQMQNLKVVILVPVDLENQIRNAILWEGELVKTSTRMKRIFSFCCPCLRGVSAWSEPACLCPPPPPPEIVHWDPPNMLTHTGQDNQDLKELCPELCVAQLYMIRKILTHLSSLPPRTNLYANLHFIMPPYNMVIAVMFSRERGGKKEIELWLNHWSLCIGEPSHKSEPMSKLHHVENTVNFRQNRKCFLRWCCFERALSRVVYVYRRQMQCVK